MKWVSMEYYKHLDGLYYVVRFSENGELSTSPFGFKSKESAISYIKSHGLQAIERK